MRGRAREHADSMLGALVCAYQLAFLASGAPPAKPASAGRPRGLVLMSYVFFPGLARVRLVRGIVCVCVCARCMH